MITSITQKFTLFIFDGTPVRATLNVSFRQIEDEGALAQTEPDVRWHGRRAAVDRERRRHARLDCLQGARRHESVAEIADANQLTRVRGSAPGTVLEIPNG